MNGVYKQYCPLTGKQVSPTVAGEQWETVYVNLDILSLKNGPFFFQCIG